MRDVQRDAKMVSPERCPMKKRVLFLCIGNSTRSQMAEALLPLIAGDYFETSSAGTEPVGLNPAAVTAMQELGVDISHRRSKHVSEFLGRQFDYVITVCDRARESCPTFPTASRLLHWSFEDPAAAPDADRETIFRRVRDEITDTLWQFVLSEEHLPADRLTCYRCNIPT